MINKLKEIFCLYVKNFGKILTATVFLILIGIPTITYLEISFGLDKGKFEPPSEIGNVLFLIFSLIILLIVFLLSQFVLSASMKNSDKKVLDLYYLAWGKLPAVFQEIKKLWKLFGFKHLFFCFVIWFILNGGTANIIKESVENIWIEQTIFVLLNFLFIVPFFHMYGIILSRKKWYNKVSRRK